MLTSETSTHRYRLTVTGVVQGVGFRPFVYGLALKHGLNGFVGNDSGGVFIEIEGDLANLQAFYDTLTQSPPPLAHLETVAVTEIPPTGSAVFTIVHSETNAAAHTLISPDICICADCRRELFDPADRRYRYPFINCTNCGPRFTIIKDIPYDRPLTTMAPFPLFPTCQAEYDDPLNRRFHAQPNACPVCGPHIWLEMSDHLAVPAATGDEALRQAQHLLAEGRIVAVKGIGGFHLAGDATNEAAVALLRQRKGRVDKPLAVMALDVATTHQLAELSAEEEALLTSKERPILLLKQKTTSPLSRLIAPGNDHIGVMLPYSPLHYLLLSDLPTALPVLVMTSGNYSQEPIVKDNDEARPRLAPLADAFLLHNRDICGRCDDSVIRLASLGGQPTLIPIRRSRGYAPFPVKLPLKVSPILAVGGELKATFCLANDDHAYMSQHIGDMENLETLDAFAAAVNHFQTLFRLQPQTIAADLHPNYLSTRWAQEQSLPVVRVQHHHAHIAAAMAENGLDGSQPVIGFSFDGTGYGPDGAIWGGEVLIADYRGFERAFHLDYVPLAGGDVAVKRPYRLALAHLWAAGISWDEDLPPVQTCPPRELAVLEHQLRTGLSAVPTSSMGRLFDAVSSLIGVRQVVSYEGQAAIEMEVIAAAPQVMGFGENESDSRQSPGLSASQSPEVRAQTPAPGYRFGLEGDRFAAAPVIQAIVADLRRGVSPTLISARFHHAVADLVEQLSLRLRAARGLNQVALSGGVWQNVTLLSATVHRLQKHNFDILIHRLVPANDGGLALGQAMIAAVSHP